jgi:N-acetylglucosaminyldiphosphoundecaprenol N-acetyl-beta-D-mannosaminyltransferase
MEKRFTVYGTEISLMNLEKTIEFLSEYDYSKRGYICLSDTFVVVLAERHDYLRSILNNSILTLPDGRPIEFYARIKGFHGISTVSGYWLIKGLMKSRISHYFYGVDEPALKKIYLNLKQEFGEVKIVGFKAPPILSQEEIVGNKLIEQDMDEINRLGPDIIWVGISSPKQDILISNYSTSLQRGIMIGVGGVLDYLSENKKISPEWIKKIGLRWFYRLIHEPVRLWRKYLFTFSRFFILLIRELFDRRKFH